MTDAIHTIETYDDLVAVDTPTERARTHIAVLLTEGADSVLWLPKWLATDEDRDLAPAHAHPQLFVGEVYEYSDKALCIEQVDHDAEYAPTSEAEAFTLADGVETIDTPQTGLGSFGVDG